MDDLGICGLGTALLYTPDVASEIETVINLNLEQPMTLVALFISRLLKGLQNLSNAEDGFHVSWGRCSYEIEDIGTVFFRPVLDPETGEKAFLIDQIQWKFETSRFFSSFQAT